MRRGRLSLMASAQRQSRLRRDRQTPQQPVPCGQFPAFSRGPMQHTDLMTQSRFSSSRAACERETERKVARSVGREMSTEERIMKKYKISPRSDISKFSSGTVSARLTAGMQPGFSASINLLLQHFLVASFSLAGGLVDPHTSRLVGGSANNVLSATASSIGQ
jgi:hypothetical protein